MAQGLADAIPTNPLHVKLQLPSLYLVDSASESKLKSSQKCIYLHNLGLESGKAFLNGI
jgi:hypothetical protein